MGKVLGEVYCGKIRQPQDTHAACLFLLDVSDSMNWSSTSNKKPIDNLNEAIGIFKEQACLDETSRNIIDIAIITFGGREAKVISEFKPITDFEPPLLTASGCTPMGKGLELAIDVVKKRVDQYNKSGTDVHIPWIVMITDGKPTDSLDRAKQLLKEEAALGQYGHLHLWIVATDEADLALCRELTLEKRILYVEDKDYHKVFDWTRKSMVFLSRTNPLDNNDIQVPEDLKNNQISADKSDLNL